MAYRHVKGKVSTRVLADTLQQLDYLYPYQQSIGFLLEKSKAFMDEEIEPFCQLSREFDFYLTHKMKATVYSDAWKLYYPSVLDADEKSF